MLKNHKGFIFFFGEMKEFVMNFCLEKRKNFFLYEIKAKSVSDVSKGKEKKNYVFHPLIKEVSVNGGGRP